MLLPFDLVNHILRLVVARIFYISAELILIVVEQ